jgi:N,N'-diacetyllegionaminate synthase
LRPLEIIAEVANAHQGDATEAARLAAAGLAAGADAVKFQVYFADELLVRTHPRFKHFSEQAFPEEAWPDLLGGAKEKGGRVYCDVFGRRALEVAEASGADGYKIHTSDLGNTPLLEAARETGKPIYLSAGGSTARELSFAVNTISRPGGSRPVLMHGYQSFPTAVEESCLVRLGWLGRHFGRCCDIGYQDHVAGDDSFAFHLPLMALGAGARVIEKHITGDRAAEGVDWYSSLEPGEFADFVAAVRRADSAIGHAPESFTDSERSYRRTMKKYWVATRSLPEGHALSDDDLTVKRVAEEGPDNTVERDKLIGRPLVHAITEEHPLTRADVKNIVWATVVARTASRRMPGKALKEVAGMATVRHLLERLKLSETLDHIVFCTTTLTEDNPLVDLAAAAGVDCHRGPVEDVLERMLGALEGKNVDVVVRITGDDILVDPDYLDRAVMHHLSTNAEYSDMHALPSGTEVEVFDFDLLRAIRVGASDTGGTEYLTWYVTRNGDQFRRTTVPVDERHRRDWRLTIDTPKDFPVVSKVLEAMAEKGKALTYRLDDIVAYLDANPDVLSLNITERKRGAVADVDTTIDWSRFLST